MKKEVAIILTVVVVMVLVISVAISAGAKDAEKVTGSKSDEKKGLWSWLKSIFTKSTAKPTGVLRSTADKKLMETIKSGDKVTGRVTGNLVQYEYVWSGVTEKECKTILCDDGTGGQYICPKSMSTCSARYYSCKDIDCEKEALIDETDYVDYSTSDTADDTSTDTDSLPILTTTVEMNKYTSTCQELDNVCYSDTGQKVVCRGVFDNCDAAFYNCSCGVDESVYSGTGSDSGAGGTAYEDNCQSRRYLCTTQASAYNAKEGSVVCKGSLSKCMVRYDDCKCDTRDTTWFDEEVCEETVHLCQDSKDNYIKCAGTYNYCNRKYYNRCDCGYDAEKCRGLTVNEDVCDAHKQTCVKNGGVKLQVDGSLSYCAKQCSGTCVCGIDSVGST